MAYLRSLPSAMEEALAGLKAGAGPSVAQPQRLPDRPASVGVAAPTDVVRVTPTIQPAPQRKRKGPRPVLELYSDDSGHYWRLSGTNGYILATGGPFSGARPRNRNIDAVIQNITRPDVLVFNHDLQVAETGWKGSDRKQG